MAMTRGANGILTISTLCVNDVDQLGATWSSNKCSMVHKSEAQHMAVPHASYVFEIRGQVWPTISLGWPGH